MIFQCLISVANLSAVRLRECMFVFSKIVLKSIARRTLERRKTVALTIMLQRTVEGLLRRIKGMLALF
jgi:hypothetical protein